MDVVARPAGRPPTWIRDRLAALALLRHQSRVNDSYYAESGRPAEPFHIGG